MKKYLYFILLFTLGFILILGNCVQAVPDNGDDDGPVSDNKVGEEAVYPYMDIIQNKINNVSADMEYSTNDRADWTNCNGAIVNVTFLVGDNVWIREIGQASTQRSLGIVEALSGRPDFISWKKLYIGENNWDDMPYGSPFDVKKIMFWFNNIGDTSGYDPNHEITFYISDDTTITTADTKLLDYSYNYSCPVGEVYGGQISFTVPDLTPDIYYIGCIIDSTNQILELNEGNNVTSPAHVAEFTIKDPSANTNSGAFKFINSWGTGTWENIADGHYWVTYATMIKQQMMITYYYNDFSHIYKPTVIAVFKLSHAKRNECKVTLGLGDPASPYITKELQSRWNDTLYSGAQPFPNNNIVVDISEFANAINNFDVFLSVENTGSNTGTIDNFSIEFYSDYDLPAFKTITGGTGTFQGGVTRTVTANTKGQLTLTQLQDILPLTRSSIGGTRLIEEIPAQDELARDMESIGIYEEGKNYNKIINGKYGTGYQPPKAEEWEKMYKLRAIESGMLCGTLVDQSVDHSKTQYFPPIGNQGNEGSCTCFSFAYYIQTFTEAKEHGWNISGTNWTGGLTGAPDSNLDKIFSPDFIYHQINNGEDNGSNFLMAASLIIRLGGASWQEMPYDTADSVSWPSENAFRESGRYRGREVGSRYWDFIPCGYFIIYDDSDINLLKSLIGAGYCVSTGIKSESPGLYDLLDGNDVVDNDTAAKMTTDHAQTIVGFKDGTVWDKANPDS